MSFSIQYHLFVVAGLTFILGSIIQKYSSSSFSKIRWADKLFPYAIIYFPLAITYAFIINELPLTGFSMDPIYDTGNSTSLGPQSISGEATLALIITMGSILINICVWAYSVFLIIRHFIKRRQNNQTNIST